LPNFDAFAVDKPFSVATWIYCPKEPDSFVVASQLDAADKSRGWLIDINGRIPALRLIGDEGKSIHVAAGFAQQLKVGTWSHLVVTYDGSGEQPGIGLYLNGNTIPTGGREPQLAGDIRTAPLRLAAMVSDISMGSRCRFSHFHAGSLQRPIWFRSATLEAARNKQTERSPPKT
jgi:hypothetical protein